MKQLNISLLSLFLIFSFSFGCKGQDGAIFEHLQPDEAFELIKKHHEDQNFVVLDVRTPEEFSSGHLPNAINIDFYAPDYHKKLQELNREMTYLIYCRTGNRSTTTFSDMEKLEFQTVYNMRGGITRWMRDGFPVSHD